MKYCKDCKHCWTRLYNPEDLTDIDWEYLQAEKRLRGPSNHGPICKLSAETVTTYDVVWGENSKTTYESCKEMRDERRCWYSQGCGIEARLFEKRPAAPKKVAPITIVGKVTEAFWRYYGNRLVR